LKREIEKMKATIEWIPVDEYGVLPDHYETVLLYIQSEPEGYVTIGMYDYIEMRWKDFCDVNREVYQSDVVTYWAHLPATPTCAGDVDELFLADS
jgi:hypothetical protein